LNVSKTVCNTKTNITLLQSLNLETEKSTQVYTSLHKSTQVFRVRIERIPLNYNVCSWKRIKAGVPRVPPAMSIDIDMYELQQRAVLVLRSCDSAP